MASGYPDYGPNVQSEDYRNLNVRLRDADKGSHIGYANADDKAAATYGLATLGFLYGFDGTAWDRLRTATPADAFTTPTFALQVAGFLMGYDGTDWNMVRVDASGHLQTDVLTIAAGQIKCYGYDGTNWQTLLVESAAQKNLRVRLYDGANAIASDTDDNYYGVGKRGLHVLAHQYGYATPNWYRIAALVTAVDAVEVTHIGQWNLSTLWAYNGATWDRLRNATPADAFTTPTFALQVASFLMGYDGSDWNMVRVDAAGHLQVDVLSSALPSGAPNYGQANIRNQLLSLSYTVLNTRLPSALDTDALKVREQGTPAQHCYGWDGANWQKLLVESAAQHNLRVGLYYGANAVKVLPLSQAVNVTVEYGLQTRVQLMGVDGVLTRLCGCALVGDVLTPTNYTLQTASLLLGYNGATYDRLRTYGTGILKVGRAEVGLSDLRRTDAGQVKASAGKLYWMTMNPSAAASIIELSDDLDGSGAVKWDMTHGVNAAHHMNIDPPLEFSTGIYLKTLTNFTSVIFGYL